MVVEGAGSGIPKVRREAAETEKIMQHFAIFWNRKRAKSQKPTKIGQELGLKGKGGGRFEPPCPPHLPPSPPI